MPHAHSHHHERRDILSDLANLLGVDQGQGQGHGQGQQQGQQLTVTATESVVYVTVAPTFSGEIGGYVTGTQPDPAAGQTQTAGLGAPVAQTTQQPTATHEPPKHTSITTQAPQTNTTQPPTTTAQSDSPTTSLSTEPASTTSEPPTTLMTSTQSTPSTNSASQTLADQFASTTASPTTSAVASSQGGISTGAKAGIAIGVLLGIGLLAGLVLLWLHKQRKNKEAAAAAAAENEKYTPSQPPSAARVPPSPSVSNYASNVPNQSTAPQVSLRPITQFNPLFNQPGGANPYATSAAAAGVVAGGQAALTAPSQAADRPYSGSAHIPPRSPRQDPFADAVNPFDNSAEAASPPLPPSKDASSPVRELTPSPTGSIQTSLPPVSEEQPSVGPAEKIGSDAVIGAAAGAAAGVVAAGAVAATAAHSGDERGAARSPNPENTTGTGSRPQSPSVGGAPAASNVHRVQMDFTPSLADEMELRAGQLVRLLKTYDDGWTQCSSMDGSVTGIAPRTCLSARPLQPRRPPGPGPRGPPPMAPNGRPMSPAGGRAGPPPQARGAPPRFYNDGRPMTPTGVPQFPPPPGTPRSMSPGPGRGSVDMPRPLTPGGSRPSSPAGGRMRSNSASVAQMGGRPPVHRGGQSPLAPPSTPLPGPPVVTSPQVDNGASAPLSIERKPIPEQQQQQQQQ